MNDLIERLRALSEPTEHPVICDCAADEIERLRAEVERLREDIKWLLGYASDGVTHWNTSPRYNEIIDRIHGGRADVGEGNSGGVS